MEIRIPAAFAGHLSPSTEVVSVLHGQSVDLNEYPIKLLQLRKCRSFRADLRHKLEIIIQSYGGWGNGGVRQTAFRLGVCRMTINNWRSWRSVPADRVMLETIDNAYGDAIERLAMAAARKRHKGTT